MLVAVADRTREIGLRKAVGATNRSIMFQFFVEGAFLTLLSGGIGMAGAAALMSGTGTACHRLRDSIRPSWCPSTAALAIRVARNCWRRRRSLSRAARSAARSPWRRSARNSPCIATSSHKPYGAMRHDLRKTILTMLGMAWGIATVVLLLAYGEGFGRAINNIFESFGATAVGIFPGRTSQQAGGNKAGVADSLHQ